VGTRSYGGTWRLSRVKIKRKKDKKEFDYQKEWE
jgi:hypothetical protein|tara:strand:+ start:246 stop:347 length:102 start_codon:yes stop_codon:yes gene_type:complete